MRDRTEKLGRRIRGDLDAGEEVRAVVALNLKGTGRVALSSAATASDGVATFRGDPVMARSREQAEAAGIGKGPYFYLAVTSRRLLVYRRSIIGRLADPVLDLPLEDVGGVRISKQGHAVILDLGERGELKLETPKAFKFLPDVYERLPAIVAEAKAAT